jgi:CIC family chloride channel protein
MEIRGVSPKTSEAPEKLSYLSGFGVLYSRLIAWSMRRVPNERQRLLAVTILAGGLCGLAAVAFHLTIGVFETLIIDRANAAPGHSWIWWTILAPAVGGLIAGVGLTYWVPGAAGSGIPQVKVAYALRSGLVPFKEALG